MSAHAGIRWPNSMAKSVQRGVADEVSQILMQHETCARLANIGADLTPLTPAQFQAFHGAENKRYAELTKKRGIQAD